MMKLKSTVNKLIDIIGSQPGISIDNILQEFEGSPELRNVESILSSESGYASNVYNSRNPQLFDYVFEKWDNDEVPVEHFFLTEVGEDFFDDLMLQQSQHSARKSNKIF
jgi:hypothetical protein